MLSQYQKHIQVISSILCTCFWLLEFGKRVYCSSDFPLPQSSPVSLYKSLLLNSHGENKWENTYGTKATEKVGSFALYYIMDWDCLTGIRLNSSFVGFCHMMQDSPIERKTTFSTWWPLAQKSVCSNARNTLISDLTFYVIFERILFSVC